MSRSRAMAKASKPISRQLLSAMPLKRRRSSASDLAILPGLKRTRIQNLNPLDHFSSLSDELIIRVLHHLPIHTLIQCQRLSHRLYTLAGDSQIWKSLYYDRFVLPRALRIPGIRTAPPSDAALHFSSRRSKWLDENTLVNRVDGKKTDWKRQYKLRHNWSIGACGVQEIHVADRPSVPSMLVKLAEGCVVTVDKEDGLRAWNLKERGLIASCELGEGDIPTCVAVDEEGGSSGSRLGIAVGFIDGSWGTWKLDVEAKIFVSGYRSLPSINGMLSAIAFANPYILTITDSQLLSLYNFQPAFGINEEDKQTTVEADPETAVGFSNIKDPPMAESHQVGESKHTSPHLLASLKSHTSWPPLSLSIRTTTTTLIASIAYSLPTYYSGYTIGLQELHLSRTAGIITFSRLASALPQGFSSVLAPTPSSSPPSPKHPAVEGGIGSTTSRPTTLSYSHPYILATHPDNTLTLYLCTSTSSTLHISPGTKLWGHTSSVSSAEITARGKAVSVSTRGNELRVWELEGGLPSTSSSSHTPSKARKVASKLRADISGRERSVKIKHPPAGTAAADDGVRKSRPTIEDMDIMACKRWVGFDDEVVIVLKESEEGTQALVVYDFT